MGSSKICSLLFWTARAVTVMECILQNIYTDFIRLHKRMAFSVAIVATSYEQDAHNTTQILFEKLFATFCLALVFTIMSQMLPVLTSIEANIVL